MVLISGERSTIKACNLDGLFDALGDFQFEVSLQEGVERMIQWHHTTFSSLGLTEKAATTKDKSRNIYYAD